MKYARLAALVLAVLVCVPSLATAAGARATEGVAYRIAILDPATQTVEVEATFPVTTDLATLYAPVWTPGYYVREDYKKDVVALQVHDERGRALKTSDAGQNQWSIEARGARKLVVRYTLSAKARSVSRNEVTPSYAVLNGSATYMALKGTEHLVQHVALSLPKGWVSATGMRPVESRAGPAFVATDYQELVDSPIMAGDLDIRTFFSKGTPHQLVFNKGAAPVDATRLMADLKVVVDETRDFWGAKPWPNYAFLIAIRPAGGGLEHSYSTMVNVHPDRFRSETGYAALLGLLAHEYQHAFNVKRLRPAELVAFDYEQTPTLSTLWISEGLTSYYSNLMLRRSGLIGVDAYLSGLSKQITALQNAPGRLKQSLEQSSREVWSNSNSGVAASDATVSYYIKGEVVGLLMDAHIRKQSQGRASLDDVMHAAYRAYSGKRGFTSRDFTATAETATGLSLASWLGQAVSLPGELDYGEALDWYGLRLEREPAASGQVFKLAVSPDASGAQDARLKAWLGQK